MKKLIDILNNVDTVSVNGNQDISVVSMTSDSRKVQQGSLFFAMHGVSVDGHKFIDKAIENGAAAVVYSDEIVFSSSSVCYIKTSDVAEAYALASSNWFDCPSSKLIMVGVTGTNGKTTTATLLYKLFNLCGYKSGLLSTVKYIAGDKEIPATHTTPDAFVLNELLSEMLSASCKYCFMEISSHALVQKRVFGIDFKLAIFSNITHDHLDYHKTFDAYIKAKKTLFDNLSVGSIALYNADDVNGSVMVQNTKAKKYSYALQKPSDFKTKIFENRVEGLELQINGVDAWFRLPGRFNAYNLTAVYASAVLLGIDKMVALQNLSNIESVDGRFNVVRSNREVTAVVDYAHTPDALKNVLETICDLNQGRGRIICVAGAGGDRDKTKRPEMGKIMAHFSDLVIITSDNSRSEDPNQIISEIKGGIEISKQKNVLCIVDRKEAIKTACALAVANDIILIAGKGHETYQEVHGVRTHFDDKEIVAEFLNN